jgi:UDP-N-acetylmuramate-alanine ligase
MRALLQAAEIPFTQDPWAAGYHPTLVGHSSAIRPGHPLRTVATTHGAELVRRGELLARVASTKKLVAICGSHGKTTTCGLVIAALEAAGADFGHVLGGLFRDSTQSPARASQGPWLVAEVDESDGTIGAFSPEITVAVNLDWDHPDYYRTEADLERVFADLFRRTRSLILIPSDSPRLRRLAAGSAARVLTVGPGGDLVFDASSAGPGRSRATLSGLWPRASVERPV